MTEGYDAPIPAEDGYTFQLDTDAGPLYVLTGGKEIADLQALCEAALSEQDWLVMTAGLRNGLPQTFFSGSVVLTGDKTADVTLTRNFARLDLAIRSIGSISVERIFLEGVAEQTPLFGTDAPTRFGSLDIRPEAPYTEDTAGVAFLYPQEEAARLRAEVQISGKRYVLEADLPGTIRRNRIYTVTISKESVDQEAQLTVVEWASGGDTGLYPDWSGRITIDSAHSELPAGAILSADGTEITLPHGLTDFRLVVTCNDDLEAISPAGSLLTVETASAYGQEERNVFRVRKPLYAPGMPAEQTEIRFRRKGLNNAYPEDRIVVRMSANPVGMTGKMTFDTNSYAFDFGRYIDNELGRFTVPADKKLTVEFAAGEDPWIKITPVESSDTFRVLAGWKPNDPTADGRTQQATLVICNTDGSAREEYTVARRNFGLPVTWLHGVWWCKYNARGNSRAFEDQVLSSADPAAAAGKRVLDYLRDCSPEEFYDLWGWAYQGDSGIGLRVVDNNGSLVMDGFSTGMSAHINKLAPDALAPDGYELPSMEDFNRMFDATDYVWVMWGGTHTLRNPWEGHKTVKREQRRRNDITVGSVQATDLLYTGMSSPDFPEYEPVTWYGPGAQWDANGIKHSNHYNNILFSVYSPEGAGWFFAGPMTALYLQKNGAGNNDTRILRFKKSPVEYIYE